MEIGNLFNETQFFTMSSLNYTRPAQVPVLKERFNYLTKQYSPGTDDSNWVMFHHHGHFIIYHKETKGCVFDATYRLLRNPEEESDDEIVAVITDVCINEDDRYPIIENDFSVLADLIKEGL